jgi:DNA-binding SARP family transcriptional activator/tetratricopeptide (TPR) repeat protein
LLRLTTFGGLALTRDGVTLTGAAAQRSRLSLLALLATAGPTGFSRDKLLLYLWPESDEERARHALKQAVYSLRRELGSDEVIVGTASLSLNPVFITNDAREFETAIAAGDLATAVALYSGPFLDGFHLKDSTEYERWSAEQRARFAHMWVSSVEKLAADCESRGAWREAAGYWRTLAASEPLSGRLALALMRALAESGDLGAALQQFRIHESLLRDEIGSAPEAAVTAFAESLKNGTWVRSPESPRRPSPVPAAGPLVPVASVASMEPPPTAVPQPAKRQSIGAARRRRKRSTALAFVLGALLIMAIGLTVTYARLNPELVAQLSLIRNRPPAKLEPRQIIVAPFENKTGADSLSPIGDLAAEWLSRELDEADFIVVDARTARLANRVVQGTPGVLRPEEKVAIGEESGSRYAIVGSYYREGRDSLQANISVVDVATRRIVRSLGPFRGTAAHLSEFLGQMLQPTVAYLHAEVDTSAGGRTTRYSSPTSIAVQDRVNKAWEHFFQNSSDTTGIFAELDSAARLDPNYPMPTLMKAYMLDVKSQWPGVKQQVDRASPLAENMTKLERGALELYESDLRGDATRRVAIARRLQAMSPASTEMPLLRVVSALYVGNVPEALAALEDIDPTRGMNVVAPTYFEWAATTYHHSGDATLEVRAVRELQKRFRDKPPAIFALTRLHAANNDRDLDDVLRRGVPEAGDRNARSDSIELRLFAARELRAHGHANEAMKLFAETLTRFWPPPSTPTSLEERRRQARTVYETGDDRRALPMFQAILAIDSLDFEAMGRIGAASARLGDSATARLMDDRLERIRGPYLMGIPLRWRAVIASARGKPDEAVSLLDKAIRHGFRLLDSPINLTVHLDRDFMGIEKTERYKAMLQGLTDASAPKMTPG